MAIQISMPKLGLSTQECTVVQWLKNEGDIVKQGEALLEVMTEKSLNIVEAPTDGILLKIVADKNAILLVGGLLGIIGQVGEDINDLLKKANASSKAVSAVKTTIGNNVKISPAARKLAQDNGIDYTLVVGTGPDGRIIREDIESAIAKENTTEDDRPALEVFPYRGIRRIIGENMVNSLKSIPKVTHHTSVDLSALQALRTTLNSEVKDAKKISVTDIVVKAVATALENHPKINATLSGDKIRVLADINIGVAIAIPDGIVVPVVKNANKKSMTEISKEIKDFAERAQKNKLERNEMNNGTFTITNLGSYKFVDWFTPIISQPELAVLGVGRTVKKPVVINDQIVIRPIMGLSLSFDHRVIDGAPAAEFLGLLIELIEQPDKLVKR